MIKIVIGLVVGFLIGAGCRYFDIPVPSPPVLPGALLVVAMTLGYTSACQDERSSCQEGGKNGRRQGRALRRSDELQGDKTGVELTAIVPVMEVAPGSQGATLSALRISSRNP